MPRRLLAFVVVCACGAHDGPMDAGVDAADDALSLDVGRDTGAQIDGDSADGDAADASVADGWVSVTGSFPATARLHVADPGLVDATIFPIEPCPGRAGCRRIVQTWPSGPCVGRPLPCSPFVAAYQHGHHDGTTGTVFFALQSSPDQLEFWAVDDRGRARAGFRTGTYPALGDADVNADSIAFSVGSYEAAIEDFVLVAPYASPLSFTDLGDVNDVTPGTGDSLQRLQLGEGAIAGEMNSLVVARIPTDGSMPFVASGGEGTLGAIAGQTIFHDTYRSSEAHVYVARPGEPSEQLITGTRANSDRIATDGTDLVWLEFDRDDASGNWIDFEVWTSPYAERSVDLVPRRLDSPASASLSSPIIVGFGHAAVHDGVGGMRIYRLADGYHANLAPPAGELWFSPAYIGPLEIAVAAHTDDRRATTQICFIELASLEWLPSP